MRYDHAAIARWSLLELLVTLDMGSYRSGIGIDVLRHAFHPRGSLNADGMLSACHPQSRHATPREIDKMDSQMGSRVVGTLKDSSR